MSKWLTKDGVGKTNTTSKTLTTLHLTDDLFTTSKTKSRNLNFKQKNKHENNSWSTSRTEATQHQIHVLWQLYTLQMTYLQPQKHNQQTLTSNRLNTKIDKRQIYMDWDYSTSNTNNYLHMTLLTYHDLNKPSKHLCLTLASASWFMHQLRICFHTKKKLPALQCRIKGLPLTLFTGYYWLLPCIMHQNLTKHRNCTSHKLMQGLAQSQIIFTVT